MMDKNQREKLFEIARKISEPCYNIMILAYENTEEQAASQNEKRLLTWALNKEVIPYWKKMKKKYGFTKMQQLITKIKKERK